GEGDQSPSHVMRAVAGLAKNSGLAARHHFDRRGSFEKTAKQIDVIGEHVEDRRGMRGAAENWKGLGPRSINGPQATADLAETAAYHLFLGAQEAFLEATAIADAQQP